MATRVTPARAFTVLLLAVLVGCATAPISPAIQAKVKAQPVAFQELAANPTQYKGNTVILGGRIINTVPTPDGTLLTILQTKTEGEDRPEGPETSQGRFMAVAKGFLDPQVYSSGRQVTVAGTVAGKRAEKVGAVEYTYPLVQAEQVYLWPRPEPGYYAYPGDGWPYWAYEPFYPGPVFVPGGEIGRGERGEMEEHGEMGEHGGMEGHGGMGGGGKK